jgi:hypothetical protein
VVAHFLKKMRTLKKKIIQSALSLGPSQRTLKKKNQQLQSAL